MAHVIQTGRGEVRLFADRAAAEAWEARQPADCCIVAGAEVNAAKHWRGPIPAEGVRFTEEDQSTAQLIGAMDLGE